MKQTTEYRMVSKGNVIHFCAKCPYYGLWTSAWNRAVSNMPDWRDGVRFP